MKTLTICFVASLALGLPSCAFDAADEYAEDTSELDDFYGPYHEPGVKKPPRPYAMAEEATALLAQGTCQADLGFPFYSNVYWNHDDYFFGYGCGKYTNDHGGTGGTGWTQHAGCNGAICVGPGNGTGHNSAGSLGYCILPNGSAGNFGQCWDVTNPCSPVRKQPEITAATCPAGRPFCDDCYIYAMFPAGMISKKWGHDSGPDGVCKTADDVYRPFPPYAGPNGGPLLPDGC